MARAPRRAGRVISMETPGSPADAVAGTTPDGPASTGPGQRRSRLASLVPALRTAGFVVAVGIVVVIAVRAAREVDADRLTWWPLPLALAAAVGWWLLLARGWGILVAGRAGAKDVSTWCRTQTLRYLPGGVWAPASRAAIVRGGLLDRISTVAAENVIALCAALALGGVALAVSGAPLWLPIVLILGAPTLASRLLADRTRLASGRTHRATLNYLFAFAGYGLAAALVQAAVSGFQHPLAVGGGALVAWAAGLVVVFAPSGVGVRELTYVAVLSHTLPAADLAAGAVTLRIVTIAAELGVLVVAGRPRRDMAAMRTALAPTLLFLRRHAVFLGVLVAGIALRILTTVAYRPALLSYDSQGFFENAAHLRPDPVRPIGYPLFLRIVDSLGGIAAVPAVQHLLGILVAVLIYAVLLRLGVPRWAAALAAAPVLLDAYQLDIEHYVLAETLFESLVVGACAALLWRRRPGILAAAIAGLLLAGAALTRANGIVVFLPSLAVVLCLGWKAAPAPAREGERAGGKLRRGGGDLRRGLRPALPVAVVLLAAFAVPVAAYGVWYQRVHGNFAITGYGKRFLYARVTPFVDCTKFSVPRNERALCPIAPVGKRPTMAGSTVEFYMWHSVSPVWRVHVRVAGDFARRAILAQPGEYLRTVSHDFLRGFAPIRTAQHGELPISRWQFPPSYPEYLPNTRDVVRAHGGGSPSVDRGLAHFLRGYQRFGFAPGPVLAIGLLAGLLAALGLGRARGSGLRAASFLFASAGCVAFGSTVLANQFSWRYVLPLVVLLPPAAALGLTACLGRRQADPTRAGRAEPAEAKVQTPAAGRPPTHPLPSGPVY
ncbi:MAG: phospholipid carrier-dependent glycosyltransferase [Actinomycetota bacterium]|nr:phospholipid carrier-dependent glycosyltransferase [Actinomycetota bacterium]